MNVTLKNPSKYLNFRGIEYVYSNNKHNISVYKELGDSSMLIVEYNPNKNTYYVLHKIICYVKYSYLDDDDLAKVDLENLSGNQRMAYPSKNKEGGLISLSFSY